jgi:histidine triad (HIT) family protein
MMIELPIRVPCDLCVAIRDEPWKIIDACEHTVTLINPRQFEVGQCCVVTRRHVATLLDLSPEECAAVMVAAHQVAKALVETYAPLGLLTFQNNGVYSGQETPHFHFHVVPRQVGSDWGVGPPQLAHVDGTGRPHNLSRAQGDDPLRHERVLHSSARLSATVERIRASVLAIAADAQRTKGSSSE